MRLLHFACCLLLAACCFPAPVGAHGATAGSEPLVPVTLRLRHRTPAEVVALLLREERAPENRVPRAARSANDGARLPPGVDAVMRTAGPDEVVLVGAPSALSRMEECLRVLDAPAERVAPGAERVTLTLGRASSAELRRAVRRLAGGGTATAEGRRLVLEGTPAWLHRALREVARAEMGLEPASTDPRP